MKSLFLLTLINICYLVDFILQTESNRPRLRCRNCKTAVTPTMNGVFLSIASLLAHIKSYDSSFRPRNIPKNRTILRNFLAATPTIQIEHDCVKALALPPPQQIPLAIVQPTVSEYRPLVIDLDKGFECWLSGSPKQFLYSDLNYNVDQINALRQEFDMGSSVYRSWFLLYFF